ncbi:MAG TPA: hypothetical protein VJC39_03380 [Candidatus Nanoarchaeia archaeon]|nr:hypothetical protein [Candidatus Nanoarchaeia archaeon]
MNPPQYRCENSFFEIDNAHNSPSFSLALAQLCGLLLAYNGFEKLSDNYSGYRRTNVVWDKKKYSEYVFLNGLPHIETAGTYFLTVPEQIASQMDYSLSRIKSTKTFTLAGIYLAAAGAVIGAVASAIYPNADLIGEAIAGGGLLGLISGITLIYPGIETKHKQRLTDLLKQEGCTMQGSNFSFDYGLLELNLSSF